MPSRLASIVLAITALSACQVEDPEPTPDPEQMGGTDAGGDETPAPDAAPPEELDCEAAATTLPFGNHNAGAACLSCHTGTGAAPKWTIAGTIYTSSTGAAPLAGATMIITDATGAEIRLISASNGNFYTQQAVTFPVRVTASRCPDQRSMTSQQQSGNCNSCHSGSSRIWLSQ